MFTQMSLCFTHLVSSDQVTRPDLELLFSHCETLQQAEPCTLLSLQKGRLISLLFFEPSTRTHLSFEAAAKRLGAQTITSVGWENSSLKKGETIADTIQMVSGYSDCIVMRHPHMSSAAEAASSATVPFINAGDGANEHPTQALLDLYTVKQEIGRIDNFSIAFVGDLQFSRTVHSLITLLKNVQNVHVTLVSPNQLQLPDFYKQQLIQAGIAFTETTDMQAAFSVDICYITRVQEERFKNRTEYEQLKDTYIVRAKDVPSTCTILSPLPRKNEIHTSVDTLPNAAYFRQAANGMYVRMALLDLLLSTI